MASSSDEFEARLKTYADLVATTRVGYYVSRNGGGGWPEKPVVMTWNDTGWEVSPAGPKLDQVEGLGEACW